MLAARVVPPVDTASLATQLAAGGLPGAHGKGADGDHAAEGKEGEGKDGAEAAPPAIHLLDNIVMNPAGSNGQRFLLLSVAYELKAPGVGEKLKVRDAEVRDVVQRVVGARTIEQLADMNARDALKADVLRATEDVVGRKSIARVFFPQFVIQ
jgi:flagellar FliL protein